VQAEIGATESEIAMDEPKKIIGTICILLAVILGIILFQRYRNILFGKPDVEWIKTFGEYEYDEARDIKRTYDGGYIIAGLSNSYSAGSHTELYLVKTDEHGKLAWYKTYRKNQSILANSVEQTADSGYIVTGYTFGDSASFDYDIILLKTDKYGEKQWLKTFGGDNNDAGNAVIVTTAGEYLIVGETCSFVREMQQGESDIYIMVTDTCGDTLWTKSYGGSGRDVGMDVKEIHNRNFVITGSSTINNLEDVIVMKIDNYGTVAWSKTYGENGLMDMGRSIQVTNDGGYIVVGTSFIGKVNSFCWKLRYFLFEHFKFKPYFPPAYMDMYVLRLDCFGDTLWTNRYGRKYNDEGYGVRETENGEFIVGGFSGNKGYSKSYSIHMSQRSPYIIKVDSIGNVEWKYKFGKHARGEVHSVEQTIDGGYVLAGVLYRGRWNGDLLLIKLKAEK
jgi:hypothetical protein